MVTFQTTLNLSKNTFDQKNNPKINLADFQTTLPPNKKKYPKIRKALE